MKEKKAILINDTSFELHHGSNEVIHNLKNLLTVYGFKISYACPVGKDWCKSHRFKKAITKADLIIVNGEGSLHHDQPTAFPLAFIATYAQQKGIPTVLLNTTYQDNCELITNNIRSFNLIYVREKRSQIELSRFKIQSVVVPDLTFHSSPNLLQPRRIDHKAIGITDSAANDLSTKLYNSFKNHPEVLFLPIISLPYVDHRRPFRSLLKTIIFKIDRVAHYNKKASWSQIKKHNALPNISTYKNHLMQLSCLLTGRYHALCFALQLRIPFLTLKANTYKMEGLLDDVGLGYHRLITNFDKLNDPHLFDDIAFTEEENFKISNYIANAKINIDNMFRQIRQLVA